MEAPHARMAMRSAVVAGVTGFVFAVVPAPANPALPREIWAVKPVTFDAAALERLRARNINAVVVRRITTAQRARARSAKLLVVSTNSRRGLRIVRLAGPSSVLRVKRSGRGRTLALVSLTIDFRSGAWTRAVARAAAAPWLDLAVVPRGRKPHRALATYLALMNRVRRRSPLPPPAPPSPPGLTGALPASLPASAGVVFHVAKHGSNSDAGTAVQPWLTIQKALNTLTAGQRVWVHNGTYAENLRMDRAGSPVAPITVEAAPGEHPILDAAGSHPLEIGKNAAYFRFRGFVIQDAPGNSGGNVDVYGHHVEISANEITRGRDQGVYTDEDSHHVHILGNWIHHNGAGVIHQSHGIYLQGDDHLVANNVIHDHPEGFGIQVYDEGHRAIVTGNTITGAGHSGIVVGGSGGVSGVRVHNNVLAFNDHWGISNDSSCPRSSVASHNVLFANRWGPTRGCAGLSFAGGNRPADPLLATYAARDFRLLGGSPAVDYGLVPYSPATDFSGVARTYGSGPDAGAFERF